MQPEYSKNAVITIQGGGTFGLSLLGQAQALIEDYGYVPMAYSGTSAGAIIATLLWAGLTPTQISEELMLIAGESGNLGSLVGPFDAETMDVDISDLRQLANGPQAARNRIARFLGINSEPEKIGVFHALALRKSLNKYQRVLSKVARSRGLFCADTLEHTVDRLIRKALSSYEEHLPSQRPVTFNDITVLTRIGLRAPVPLLIAATNLTKGNLELFNSIDPKYGTVPIARAVRASAGYPLVLQPLKISEGPSKGWYADGGLISNFPSWIFAQQFRSFLSESAAFTDAFKLLASFHWVHVGLRVVDDERIAFEDLAKPRKFAKSLIALTTGQARNELENKLANTVPRSIIVRQPIGITANPGGVMDADTVTPEAIRKMVERGRYVARNELQQYSFTLPGNGEPDSAEIQQELKALVEKSAIVMGRSATELGLRANVMIPIGGEQRLLYSVNMEGDPDEHIVFPWLTGLSGWTIHLRRRCYCNLKVLRKLAKNNVLVFDMDVEQQEKIEPNRTWLACTPIFDPDESLFQKSPVRFAQGEATDTNYPFYQFEAAPMDGAVIGVLSIDASWRYSRIKLSPITEEQYRDVRIRCIFDCCDATANRLGKLLGRRLARKVAYDT